MSSKDVPRADHDGMTRAEFESFILGAAHSILHHTDIDIEIEGGLFRDDPYPYRGRGKKFVEWVESGGDLAEVWVAVDWRKHDAKDLNELEAEIHRCEGVPVIRVEIVGTKHSYYDDGAVIELAHHRPPIDIKDWEWGKCRIKIEIITAEGSSLSYYLPHVDPSLGDKVIDVATEIAGAIKAKEYPRVYVDGKSIVGKPT